MAPNPVLPPSGPPAAALTHDSSGQSQENWAAGQNLTQARERSERRIMRPQLAPGPDTPTQWSECARGGPMERLGLYPGAGGTAGCVPQEDEWGGRGRRRGRGGPGRRASSEDAEGEQNMERWEKRGCRPRRCCLGVGWGETPEAGGTAPAPSARSPVLTLVCAPHGFQSNSPK